MRRIQVVVFWIVCLLSRVSVSGDSVKLKDGRELLGTVESGTKTEIRFQRSGITWEIPVEQIQSIRFEPVTIAPVVLPRATSNAAGNGAETLKPGGAPSLTGANRDSRTPLDRDRTAGTAGSISSVIFEGSPAKPAVRIHGWGFGLRPPASSIANPGDMGEDYGTALGITDSSGRAPFEAGYDNPSLRRHDTIGLVISTYSDADIAFTLGSTYSGFYYPNHIFQLNEGDSFTVSVGSLLYKGTVHFRAEATTQATLVPTAGANQFHVNPVDGLTYVWIPPGSFMMGCSPGDAECYEDEKPAHEVNIPSGFRMGQTTVTQEAYQRVTGENPSHFKGAKLPVNGANWNEAQSYCHATGMRLPTQAEWEYAARAGTSGSRYGDVNEIAWYKENSGSAPHEVMSKAPNQWGLYDMLGNVWQWTADTFRDSAGRVSAAKRGGFYGLGANFIRVSYLSSDSQTSQGINVGFRCAGS